MPILLQPDGVFTMEFPHLLRLIQDVQFDTIYHEHFSYFSLLTVEQVFARHGIRVFDVESIPTHGGSLRIFVCHDACRGLTSGPALALLRAEEKTAGLDSDAGYRGFAERVAERPRRAARHSSTSSARPGGRVAAYGAAAKGNTLLNYCGIGTDRIGYRRRCQPAQAGPAACPAAICRSKSPDCPKRDRPDFVLILPWNLKREIVEANSYIGDWGGRFVVAIPAIEIMAAGAVPRMKALEAAG